MFQICPRHVHQAKLFCNFQAEKDSVRSMSKRLTKRRQRHCKHAHDTRQMYGERTCAIRNSARISGSEWRYDDPQILLNSITSPDKSPADSCRNYNKMRELPRFCTTWSIRAEDAEKFIKAGAPL